jgi:hypothetical protein
MISLARLETRTCHENPFHFDMAHTVCALAVCDVETHVAFTRV